MRRPQQLSTQKHQIWVLLQSWCEWKWDSGEVDALNDSSWTLTPTWAPLPSLLDAVCTHESGFQVQTWTPWGREDIYRRSHSDCSGCETWASPHQQRSYCSGYSWKEKQQRRIYFTMVQSKLVELKQHFQANFLEILVFTFCCFLELKVLTSAGLTFWGVIYFL